MPTTGNTRAHAYTFADLHVLSSLPLPELVPERSPAQSPADIIHVEWTTIASPAVAEWYHQWGDDEVWARFGESADGFVVEFPETGAFVIARDARVVEVRLQPEAPMVTARHLLLNQVLPLVLSRLRPLVLHAGAVAVDGAVVAFVGPTGAGKSTLVAACARLGAEVMADDSLVLYPEAGGWRAIPSYPAVRLWESAMDHVGWDVADAETVAHYSEKRRVVPQTGGWQFAEGPRPLTRILLLASDDQPRRPAAVELFSQVFRLDVRDRVDAVRLFHQVADLAAGVSVERIAEARADRQALDVADGVLRGSALRTAAEPGIVSKHG